MMMSKAIPHLLKTRNVSFPTKGAFQKHLKSIYDKAKANKSGLVDCDNDILDLKDFIQDYCDKSERLLDIFDLDNCHFIVKKSPDYTTKCLFIVDNNTGNQEQFSVYDFGNPPDAKTGFYSFCRYTIMWLKFEYRRKFSEHLGIDYNEYDLWHKKPTTKQIIDEFIEFKEIGEKLDEVVSENFKGNNAFYLSEKYKFLNQEFIEFYQSKVATELFFELKLRK